MRKTCISQIGQCRHVIDNCTNVVLCSSTKSDAELGEVRRKIAVVYEPRLNI